MHFSPRRSTAVRLWWRCCLTPKLSQLLNEHYEPIIFCSLHLTLQLRSTKSKWRCDLSRAVLLDGCGKLKQLSKRPSCIKQNQTHGHRLGETFLIWFKRKELSTRSNQKKHCLNKPVKMWLLLRQLSFLSAAVNSP